MKTKQLRVLVCRPDRLGDVVLSTPIPREIKKNNPNAFIAVMVRKYAEAIFENNPFVDEIIIAEDDNSDIKFSWKLVKEIRNKNFTHAFMLLPNEKINYMLFLAGIKNRIGVGHKFYQFITNTKSVHRNKYKDERHEADYCLDMVRKIGIETNNYDSEIHLTEIENSEVNLKKTQLLRGKKFLVGIHISSGGSAPNWNEDEYLKLFKQVNSSDEISVIITDNIIPNEFKQDTSIRFPNIGLSLRESILNFAALDLLISASTGPMHICAALGIKTLSLFCPLPACMPKLWGPTGNESRNIIPEKSYCENYCPGNPKVCKLTAGEGGIFAEQIADETKRILNAQN